MLEFWGAHNAAIQSVIKLPSGVLVTGTTSNGGTGVCLSYNLDKLCCFKFVSAFIMIER